jgi:hypothetical protein
MILFWRSQFIICILGVGFSDAHIWGIECDHTALHFLNEWPTLNRLHYCWTPWDSGNRRSLGFSIETIEALCDRCQREYARKRTDEYVVILIDQTSARSWGLANGADMSNPPPCWNPHANLGPLSWISNCSASTSTKPLCKLFHAGCQGFPTSHRSLLTFA